MAAKKPKTAAKKKTVRRKPRPAQTAPPAAFRLNIEVGDLERAADFYAKLLGVEGSIRPGRRCYFRCGSMTLQVVDVSSDGPPHPLPKCLSFATDDLEAVYARAKTLKCLSTESVHGQPAGKPTVRPWGERSFYVDDPWENPLCFVDARTTYL